ncbi:ROK family transcriptional regulator [Pseudolysinimonas yzui]|uniref:Sugar kinase n=1 Tax=Pseudolysinimonas yzui TaxID=2708254 RepID=A0A8J3GQF1_9MICO|nr:ROK family transcriptional regulator [Pseudolysinimonas yzui]GHF14323.1 sugar kinase [Pseudolysinimonas yzui]
MTDPRLPIEAGGAPRRVSPGTTLDDVRRQNLSQVLRFVHYRGPSSRAEITRATGLNRSTVGGLVAELGERGLVVESEALQTRRVGRPSAIVNPAETTFAITVNPEIDATEVGIVALGGRVLRTVRHRHERIPTFREFVNVVAAIIDGMRPGFAPESRIVGVGVAVPGLVRPDDASVSIAPHLGWRDAPVSALLSEATGLPVVAGNDANCGVLAESAFGAGRSVDSVVYLNGGASGIGGGISLFGSIVIGHNGQAGEFGHTLVDPAGIECHCGAIGCLETEVSRERLIAALGADSSDLDDLERALAAAWSDPASAGRREIARQIASLGVALRTIVNALNPRCVVFGGFLAAILRVVGADEIIRAIGATLPEGVRDLTLVPSTLGRDNLLIGAAELVFQRLLDDPTIVLPTEAETARRHGQRPGAPAVTPVG